jgi:undecaprenyl-diphosphatase
VLITSRGRAEPALARELLTALRRTAIPFILVGVATVLTGLLISSVLADTWLGRRDADVPRRLAAHRTPTGNTLSHVGTLLGETITVVTLTALVAIVFRFAFHRWLEPVFIVLVVVSQSLIFVITTLLIDRERPSVPHLDESPPTSSFPSGHTSAAIACYGGVALVLAWHTRHAWLKVLLAVLGVLVPVVVAVSRLYRGMHYPSDVTASVLMALAVLLIASELVLFGRSVVTKPPGRQPA